MTLVTPGDGAPVARTYPDGFHEWPQEKRDEFFAKGAALYAARRKREAAEEAGAFGTIEPRHFHLYIHSKGVFWQPDGVQEFVVKAFLMEIHELRGEEEPMRNPTWFSPDDAKKKLAKGREVKYARETEAVINRALERIQFHSDLWGKYPEGRDSRALSH